MFLQITCCVTCCVACRVQNVKSDQVDVKYRLWRGRVHCTLAKEMDSDVLSCGGGVSGESSKVFSGLSVGDVVKARVVKVREKNILRFALCVCDCTLTF